MGKKWDSSGIAYNVPMWKEMFRITKPGGFLLCFGGTRTFHRLACAIEDAGWEIRDCMMWLYGSGFPKSHNIGKAIDKLRGNKREWISISPYKASDEAERASEGKCQSGRTTHPDITKGQSEWEGYGTALKPAWEPILVCMKPKEGSFADNAEKYGVAGLNIEGGRIGTEIIPKQVRGKPDPRWRTAFEGGITEEHQGRWPANLILDKEAGEMLDEQSGKTPSSFRKNKGDGKGIGMFGVSGGNTQGHKDSGGASRFFYCAKTSKRERNLGLENKSGEKVNDGRQTPIDNPYQRGETIRTNTHPTVKPLALMKYLCTLLKMPSAEQIILDPFLGSGTTGMACKELGINFIGIEKEPEYCEIAIRRIAAVEGIHPIPLHIDNIPAEVTKVIPHNDERRQSIIDAAAAACRKRRPQNK